MTFCNMHNLREQGLILWDEMTSLGLISYDLSGNRIIEQKAGTLSTYVGTDGKAYYKFSPIGAAHIDIAGTSLLDTQAITISFWTRVETWYQNGFWFEKTIGGAVNTEYSIFTTQSYSGRIVARHIVSGYTSTNDLHIVPPDIINKWCHIVYTWDLSTRIVYCNTIPIGSSLLSGIHTTNASGVSIVGCYGGGAGFPLDGDMRHLMIFNKALTRDQIIAIYNEQYIE